MEVQNYDYVTIAKPELDTLTLTNITIIEEHLCSSLQMVFVSMSEKD